MPGHRLIDVMTENPGYCCPEHSLQDAAELMADCECNALPVVDDDKGLQPLGLLTAFDIVARCVALRRDPFEILVADCMTAPAITLPEDSTLAECIDVMRDRDVHHVIIVNGQGGLCGIVSARQIADRIAPRYSAPASHGRHLH